MSLLFSSFFQASIICKIEEEQKQKTKKQKTTKKQQQQNKTKRRRRRKERGQKSSEKMLYVVFTLKRSIPKHRPRDVSSRRFSFKRGCAFSFLPPSPLRTFSGTVSRCRHITTSYVITLTQYFHLTFSLIMPLGSIVKPK